MGLEFSLTAVRQVEVFSANITHNLGQMAREAGVYQVLWRPEESGCATAADAIPILREGLARLKADPTHFSQFNPENGWGDYSGFVQFVERALAACERNPDATMTADV